MFLCALCTVVLNFSSIGSVCYICSKCVPLKFCLKEVRVCSTHYNYQDYCSLLDKRNPTILEKNSKVEHIKV